MAKSDMRGFLLYSDYIHPVRDMTDEEAGRLFKAILSYANDEPAPELSGKERTAFSFIKVQMDINRESYERKCAVNRANGAKGGRPPKEHQPQEEKQEKPNGLQENQKNPPVSQAADQKQKPKREAKPKPPKKQYAEFVSMTEAEYAKLIEKYGEAAALRMIEILDNYKGQSEKNRRRYDSDYRAILSWVVNRYEEEQSHKPQTKTQAVDRNHTDTYEDLERLYHGGNKQ